MNKTITNDRSLVPFPVIAAASSGDVTAMDIVLKHYSGYISALATRTLYDESDYRICFHYGATLISPYPFVLYAK